MKRKIWPLILLLAALCAVCALLIGVNSRNVTFSFGEGGVRIRFSRQPYEEVIRPWYSEQDDCWYYFLPRALCQEQVIYNDSLDRELRIDGQVIPKHGRFEWEEGRTYRMLYNENEINVRMMVSSGLPAVFIHSDPLNADKDVMLEGRINIFETDGSLQYNGTLLMNGRGNSTFVLFDKKPYNIKLDRPARLLGMDRSRDWCLLANAWDYSYMNNKLAYDMAGGAGFRYTPEAKYADVWLNENYWGIYLVTEKAEVNENRIRITDLKAKNQKLNPDTDFTKAPAYNTGSERGIDLDRVPEDITGGYVIERDYRLEADYPDRKMTPSYFETTGYGTAFNIKAPEFADRREVEYIRALTSETEQAILSPEGVSETGQHWTEYIDLDSFVKCYLVAEIAYDLDKDITNTYYYKDRDSVDPRFYSGPVWDYDNRFGGTEGRETAEDLSKLASGGPKHAGGWTRYLYDRPEFYEAVCREWNGYFREYLQKNAPENIRRWEAQIEKSVGMDLVRWPRGNDYPVLWPGSDGFTSTYVFEDEVQHLEDWIRKRCAFLDSVWGE